MTISQMKKQFDEFAQYLGKDETGHQKLRQLKTSFSDLRNRLSSAEQRASEVEALNEKLYEETSRVKAECEELRLSNRSLHQKLSNAESSVHRQSTQDDAEECIRSSQKNTHFAKTVHALRKRIKHCPQFVGNSKYTHTRESFSDGWSHDDIWALGASVAVLSALWGQVTIMSNENLTVFDEKDRNKVLGWYGKHNVSPVLQTDFDLICSGAIEAPHWMLKLGLRC